MNFWGGHFLAVLLLGAVCSSQAGEYHVASTGSDANTGTSLNSAWRTIARANRTVVAGDVVIVHGGEYSDGVQPVNSGRPGSPITFQAAAGERVVLKVPVGVWLQSTHSYITVDGFEVQATSHLAILSGASHIIIRNCVMYGGREDYNAFLLSDASYCVVQNNYVDRQDTGGDTVSGDGIKLAGNSHHNLIEGNTVTHCEHIGISSALGNSTVHQSYNVIRNNTSFLNHTNFSLQDGVQRTVFEGNTGYYPGMIWTGGNGWCLQFTASSCIVRFNTLYDDTGTVYTDRKWPAVVGAATSAPDGNVFPVLYNKIYNNTIYGETDQTEWVKDGWHFENRNVPDAANDNDFKNNIVAAAPSGVQIYDQDAFHNLPALPNRYEGNLLWGGPSGRSALVRYETPSDIGSWPLGQMQGMKPDQWASSNREGNPLFVNTTGQGPAKDFHLQSGSPAIDAGVHLTVATESGSGTMLVVADAGYFCDGWGIPGVEGDSIKIEGSAPVGIASVDYGSNTLTLNDARSWAQGAHVFYYRSDRFLGNAPDIGSHEIGVAGVPPLSRPAAPAMVSPPNGTGDVSTTTRLEWLPAPSAVSYHLQVCRDTSFKKPDADIITSNYTQLSFLSPGTTYFWRVSATNSAGTSDWSEVWTLYTVAANPPTDSSNVLVDAGFENSSNSWFSYSNGQADFSVSSPGFKSQHAAKFHIAASGDNTQLYQYNITLEPNTRYVFSFAAYSSSGHDLEVSLAKHGSPFTNYGLSQVRFDLDTTWKVFTTEFTTSNFNARVGDARLLMWFATYAAAGDDYYIDNFVLAPDVTLLRTPVSIEPPAGATDQPTDITLRWSKTEGASSYDVEVALDSGFVTRVVSDTAVVDTAYHIPSLKNSTMYYWHVRSRTGGQASSFNATKSFTTNSAPLATPSWVSRFNATQPISFDVTWRPVAGAMRYRVQLATDAQFAAIVLDDSTVADTTRHIGPLDHGTDYFVRVQAVGAAGRSAFSSPIKFVTIVQAPAAPAFTEGPADNGTISTEFTVAWSHVPGAAWYHLQIASDSAFRMLQFSDSTLTDTARRIGPLPQATAFYMRVSALNAGGSSTFSPVVRFATSAAQLAVPFLLVPSGQSTNWPVNVTIHWMSVSGAVRYHLQLATDVRFTAITREDSALTDTVARIGPLSYSTLYFFRVRAINDHSASAFSFPAVFSTVPAPPSTPSGIVLASEPEKTSATLSWPSVQGALFYHLQVSGDSLFDVLALNDSTVADTVRGVASLNPSTRYFARVRAKGAGGTGTFSPTLAFRTASPPAVTDLPKDYYLEQNYPNPFNPKTRIKYTIAGTGGQGSGVSVKLAIYDLLGREVKVLVNEWRAAGYYDDTFDASGLASGVYIYRLVAGSYVQTRSMVLVK